MDIGDTAYVHALEAAACATLTICPAMVTVPVREADVLASAVTLTDVDPVPPDPTDNQLEPLPVVQVHPEPAVTLMALVPPAAVKLREVGLTLYVHAVGAAASLTFIETPATVTLPER